MEKKRYIFNITMLLAALLAGSQAMAQSAPTGVRIKGSVYGGGALAGTGGTTVNLHNGTIEGDVFGGGLGRLASGTEGEEGYIEPIAAIVNGDVLVELNGTQETDGDGNITYPDQCIVNRRIFGCNNLNGTPRGDVMVHIYKTWGTERTDPDDLNDTDDSKHKYHLEAVYGGGNLAAYEPSGPLGNGTAADDKNTTKFAHVIIDGCDLTSIQTVYGGGNAASTPATQVDINGTYEIGEAFGGGNGKDDIVINGETKPNPGANVGYKAYDDDLTFEQRNSSEYVYGSGKAQVNIHGGTIHYVYGGSNTKGNVKQIAVAMLEELLNGEETAICPFHVDEAYGGGKSAPMDGEARLEMHCIPGLNAAYGGSENADIYNNVTLNITNGKFNQVFGGNNLGGRINGSITVNIEETGCRPIIIGELYGGGNRAAYSIYGYKPETDDNGEVVTDDGGKTKWLPFETGADAAETIGGVEYAPLTETTKYANPVVNVKSFTSIGDIYGGGYGETAKMVGDPTVNINVVVGDKTNHNEAKIDAEGTLDIIDETEDHVETTRQVKYPTHTQGKIGAIRNVFGGGNAARVVGDTYVNIGTDETVDYVTTASGEDDPRTGISVVGADIRGNVYGGGNKAEVTGSTNVNIGKQPTTP